MKKNNFKKILSVILLLAVVVTSLNFSGVALPSITDMTGRTSTSFLRDSALLDSLMETATQFVVIKAKQHGGSHYAYTEAIAEEMTDVYYHEGTETNFEPGSQLVLVSLSEWGSLVRETQEVLIDCPEGVIRDADVSTDGNKILFSWKKDREDDYHLYEMILADRSIRQLTFGSGIADFEPQYTANGNIVFSSSRCIQTVDCWKTPVSNLYMCGPDGENIVRLTYDQVHDTFSTTTADGRVIYTRWDYNDRTQMWIQGVFQMNPDGTNQTELWGNNANFPTTLLHTREVPGESNMYISVASGHHTYQAGKLVMLDLSEGRNDKDAVSFVLPDLHSSKEDSIDTYGQSGALYKYPYAISKDEFLVSYAKNGWNDRNKRGTAFDICLMNTKGEKITLVKGTEKLPASQIIPIRTRTMFERASMVNYASETGTYYVADVYEGASMEGIEKGTVTHLRVVEIEYRPYALGATVSAGSGTADPFSPIASGNGAWDVKCGLGIVPVEADGSALFKVPALTPVYFQLLDKDGCVVQTMRSWTTLMPNETFSCVGCHEDKNTVPSANSNVTLAMKKGVQELQPDFWQDEDYNCYEDGGEGFDYLETVQPILDKHLTELHSNPEKTAFGGDVTSTVFDESDEWYYTETEPEKNWATESYDYSRWQSEKAPFGTVGTGPKHINAIWNSDILWLRRAFKLNIYQLYENGLELYIANAGKAEIYINGTLVYTKDDISMNYTSIPFTEAMLKACSLGDNEIAVKAQKGNNGSFIDLGIKVTDSYTDRVTLIEKGSDWNYTLSTSDNISKTWADRDFDDSSWTVGKAPFGDREGWNSDWSGDNTFLWIRQEFTIDDISDFENITLAMNVFYDDNPEFYLNGIKIYDPDNWVDQYVNVTLPSSAAKALRQGKNVLAIKCINTAGGRFLDTSLTAKAGGNNDTVSEYSLEGYGVYVERTKKNWPLSYLVLTDSYREGSNIKGRPDNAHINWISSMSGAEILPPYSAGSATSPFIQKLRSGYGGLSDKEIRTISAWIDLCVPCYGEYDTNNTWNVMDDKEAIEETNKRSFYEMLDSQARKARANGGNLGGDITVTYTAGRKKYSITDTAMAVLYAPEKYMVGDKVTITLPKGEKYVWVCLNAKMGESLIYVPDGVYTYTITEDIVNNCTYTMNGKNQMAYAVNTITARIATDEELRQTRNLAFNAYDIVGAQDAYPHAYANDVFDNAPEFAARNVIDGFDYAATHYVYPSQSWGPSKEGTNAYLTVDFGREVKVSELGIYIRADFPHDDHYLSATLTFSDGTTKNITFDRTDERHTIALPDKVTSSIKIGNFLKGGTEWAGLIEVEAIGTETEANIVKR